MGEFTCSRVFDYFLDGHIYVAVIADSCRPDTCRRLVDSCKSHLQCQMVVYCGAPCPASQLSQQRVFWEKADRNNVARVLPVIETVSQLSTQEEKRILRCGAAAGAAPPRAILRDGEHCPPGD